MEGMLESVILDSENAKKALAFKQFAFVVSTSVLLFSLIAKGFSQDKKRSKAALARSEQALERSLTELAFINKALHESSILAITDQKGKIEYVNDQFCHISNYSREELLGQNHRILNSGFHPKEFFEEMWNTISSGKTWKGDICNKTKNGDYYWVSTTIVPVLDGEGKPYQYVSIRNDITEKKKVEDSLRESEERYRKVVERSPLGIIVHQKGDIVFTNRTALDTLKMENPIGQSIFSYIHEDDQHMYRSQVSDIEIGTEIPFDEMKLIRADGSVLEAIVGGTSLIYEGKPSVMIMLRDVTESNRLERELVESETRYEQLVDISPEAILIHVNGVIRYANPASIKLLGAESIHQLMDKPIIEFSHPHYMEIVNDRLEHLNEVGIKIKPVEEKIISLDGRILDVEVTGVTMNYERNLGFLMIIRDITRRKKAEDELRQNEEQYRLIAENMTDLVRIIDVNGIVRYASPSHEYVLGFSPRVMEGCDSFELVHPDDVEQLKEQFEQGLLLNEHHTAEFRFKHAKGHWVWMEAHAKAVLNEQNQLDHFQVTARDISERKDLEEKLKNMAFYDPLTGIANRRYFQEKLIKTIKEADFSGRKFAVMYLDLDKFKHINDTLGHDVGDELLKQFSERVQGCLRENDLFARQGGDEFTILLSDMKEEQDALNVAERILASLQSPWVIDEHEFYTTSSIGIAFYPKDGTSFGELMKHADAALYEAKEAGRNNFKVFVEEIGIIEAMT